MQKPLIKMIPLVIVAALMFSGCAQQGNQTAATSSPAAVEKKKEPIYKGPIVGKSNKAKTISIQVGKGEAAQTMMLKFDDKTKGIEHAVKGHAAIIKYEMRGTDKFAVLIKPKLAKLPEGVVEIKTPDMQALVAEYADIFLVDSRPASRFSQSHLPGAVSIPVPMMKEKGAVLLPAAKDMPLVFYCGGPT